MKKLGTFLIVVSLIFVLLCGCNNTLSTTSTDHNFSIEIEDSRGNNFTLTSADLYYRFYNNVHKSAVLVNSWAHPSEISPHYLTNFFVAQSNWNQVSNDATIVFLDQEIVEDYIMMYFDVKPEQIRLSGQYHSDQKSYELPLYPLEYPSAVTNATVDNNILTLFYESYDINSNEKIPVTKGQLKIEIEIYPQRFQYISNEITFIADTQ